jgi:arylformamidase
VAHDGEGPIDHVPPTALQRGHRVLFRTGNGDRLASERFDPGFVSIGMPAAEQLAGASVALVGLDYLSVEAPDGGGAVHRVLLEAGVVLLEGLDLRAVEPGEYWLSALPVRLVGSEAAPVRAVLWR